MTNSLNFPTKDKVITLKLSLHDFYTIENCMYALLADIEDLRERGMELDEYQKAFEKMIRKKLMLIQNQAKTSTQNLDVDRLTEELKYLENVTTPFFRKTRLKNEKDKIDLWIEIFKEKGE